MLKSKIENSLLIFSIKCRTAIGRIASRFRNNVAGNTGGMGTIEVIMIIAVLVALALIFRNFIGELATKIFNKIQDKTDTAINSL